MRSATSAAISNEHLRPPTRKPVGSISTVQPSSVHTATETVWITGVQARPWGAAAQSFAAS